MTAERKIVVTVTDQEPFIIWDYKGDIGPIEEIVKNRKPGEDLFIGENDDDLTFTIVSGSYEMVLELLKAEWKLDPFFHTSGRPWTINNGHVWVLVKGSPEEIAELNPFVVLPGSEITEADQKTIDKFEGIVDVIDIEPYAIEDGRVADLTKNGWEVFNILKGSIVLVKREIRDVKSPSPIVEEAVEHELAMCYLGVAQKDKGKLAKCDGSMPPHVPCQDWDKENKICVWPGWEETR